MPQPDTNGAIDAVTVRGDPLTRAQSLIRNVTPNTSPYPLDPPDNLGATIAKKVPWYNLRERGSAFFERQKALHSMSAVKGALEKRRHQVEAQLVANGC